MKPKVGPNNKDSCNGDEDEDDGALPEDMQPSSPDRSDVDSQRSAVSLESYFEEQTYQVTKVVVELTDHSRNGVYIEGTKIGKEKTSVVKDGAVIQMVYVGDEEEKNDFEDMDKCVRLAYRLRIPSHY